MPAGVHRPAGSVERWVAQPPVIPWGWPVQLRHDAPRACVPAPPPPAQLHNLGGRIVFPDHPAGRSSPCAEPRVCPAVEPPSACSGGAANLQGGRDRMPRARRICPKPGCPKPAAGRYCEQHNREYEQARGTSTARGYDQAHRARRAAWATHVSRGLVTCWRCGQPIEAGAPWDLGHDDHDRNITRGPEHATCNRSAAGRSAHT